MPASSAACEREPLLPSYAFLAFDHQGDSHGAVTHVVETLIHGDYIVDDDFSRAPAPAAAVLASCSARTAPASRMMALRPGKCPRRRLRVEVVSPET
ncbi:MAG TPA: hypothetical protein VFE59_39315 [Trebonia sp.]|nr:hypothetical protein [Trebonia sp.]